eukprot:COSAG04_NODE_8854_length_924_cov_0.873939_1_plen_97_part_10
MGVLARRKAAACAFLEKEHGAPVCGELTCLLDKGGRRGPASLLVTAQGRKAQGTRHKAARLQLAAGLSSTGGVGAPGPIIPPPRPSITAPPPPPPPP